MELRKEKSASDAEWYCRKDPEAERFYAIFSRCAGSIECDGLVQMRESGGS